MNKNYLIGISIIALIAIFYFGFVLNEQYIHPDQCLVILNQTDFADKQILSMNSTERKFLPQFMKAPELPAVGILGIIILLLAPVIMLYSNIKVEKKISESIEILSKFNNRGLKRNVKPKPTLGRELISRLLEPKEIIVVERLLKETRPIQQKEIVKMPGMTKLKAHRLIEKLKEKGIVKVQKDGKTNLIKLDQHVKNLIMDLE